MQRRSGAASTDFAANARRAGVAAREIGAVQLFLSILRKKWQKNLKSRAACGGFSRFGRIVDRIEAFFVISN
ncbi:MAG: hypothetical protein IJJ28_08345 [Lentisphaeria bacterium]|nr:hypothetical protein [Lentisphaeria bacterium]